MKKSLKIAVTMILAMALAVAFAGCKTGFKKAVAGVQSGTTGEYYVKGDADWGFDGFSNIDVNGYDNGGLAVQAMLNGQIDFVVIDAAPAQKLAESASFKGKIKVIDYDLTEEEYAFGVDKNNAELLAKVNEIIAKIKSEGTYTTIMNKYFNGEEVTGITSGVKDINKADTQFVVATNAAFAPFEYKIGDKFAGVDMEIAQIIADELGMELVIEDMAFEAVVTSVGNNGVDIAMAGLTVNETRKQSVNFSDSYYNASQKVIVKVEDKSFDGCKSAADVEEVLKAK